MIQANELRVGNLLSDVIDLETRLVVVGITGKVIACGNEDFKHSYLHESLKPIPLTPEILLKCGFEEEITQDITLIHPSGFFFFELWDRENKCSKGYWLRFLNKFDLEIKYLHQLQNLYFALTGTELEITL